MITCSEFKEKCEKGYCLRKTVKSKQCLKDYKRDSCYDKYVKAQEKQKEKWAEPDYEWEQLKFSIKMRDNNSCRFYAIATPEERKFLDNILLGNRVFSTLDGAHLVSRSSCPRMIYHEDNVYLLSRYVHSCLDNLIDPFTQKPTSKENITLYWIRIVGEEKHRELMERWKGVNKEETL